MVCGAAAGAWVFTSRSARDAPRRKTALTRSSAFDEDRTHAALVFDADECLGWCQFGSPDELPEIKSRRRYEAGMKALPDWRITCFFTGKGQRGRGVADAALGGALIEISRRLWAGYPFAPSACDQPPMTRSSSLGDPGPKASRCDSLWRR
jgi:hypothetical protein